MISYIFSENCFNFSLFNRTVFKKISERNGFYRFPLRNYTVYILFEYRVRVLHFNEEQNHQVLGEPVHITVSLVMLNSGVSISSSKKSNCYYFRKYMLCLFVTKTGTLLARVVYLVC